MRITCRALVFLLLLLASMVPIESAAQDEKISFIRDDEVESTIRRFATPLFEAAGLDASGVRIYLVNDPRLNAFVAGGQNLFINTGLILRSKSANQLMGVIAHETGHIAGGHLARTQDAMRNATAQAIIAMVVGAAAAAASGNPNAAAAGMLGGAGLAQQSVLQYSVGQESAADQAGMRFLDRTGQSAKGLLEFFEILEGEELLSAARQDPYLRTHPLTQQRMDIVREHVEHSRYKSSADTPEFAELHAMMTAKLAAFINPPGQTLGQFKESDGSVPARYARAIAYYRIPDLTKALPLVDGLIRERPDNPWFEELKGQMLFENGRIGEALAPYEASVRLKPSSGLLRIGLAQAMIESNDSKLTKRAIGELTEAVRSEDRNPLGWHLLAVAYGREENFGMSALSLAEEALSGGDRKTAAQQAIRAAQLLPPGSPGRLRAEDLKATARLKDRD